MIIPVFTSNERPLNPHCHTFRSRGRGACVHPNPKWRPRREYGYGRLHDIPSQEMSRLADYFAVCGIDRDSKNGEKVFERS